MAFFKAWATMVRMFSTKSCSASPCRRLQKREAHASNLSLCFANLMPYTLQAECFVFVYIGASLFLETAAWGKGLTWTFLVGLASRAASLAFKNSSPRVCSFSCSSDAHFWRLGRLQLRH